MAVNRPVKTVQTVTLRLTMDSRSTGYRADELLAAIERLIQEANSEHVLVTDWDWQYGH